MSDQEELELLELENENAHAHAQAPSMSRPAADSGEALLTNLPTQGLKQNLVRGLPAMGGGIAGAATGAALGTAILPGAGTVIGGILGAGLGGASMEAARQAVSQGVAGAFPEQNYPVSRPGQVLKDVGIAGATQAASEGIGQGIGAAYRYLRPAVTKGGATAMKVAANIPEKSGEYALGDTTRLARAPSDDVVSGLYDSFHNASGTVSRKEAIAASGDPFDTVSRAMNTMRDAFNKLRGGTLTPQEAVEASQAGRIISDMKSRGVEMAQQVAEQAQNLKGSFDDFIQSGLAPSTKMVPNPLTGGMDAVSSAGSPGFPQWQAARQAAFENSVASDFSHAIPRNVNGSPNILRAWSALGGGATTGAGIGAMVGGPAGAAVGGLLGAGTGLAAVSPLAYGTAIRAAGAASKVASAVPPGVYRVVGKAGAGAAGSALADYYGRTAPATP